MSINLQIRHLVQLHQHRHDGHHPWIGRFEHFTLGWWLYYFSYKWHNVEHFLRARKKLVSKDMKLQLQMGRIEQFVKSAMTSVERNWRHKSNYHKSCRMLLEDWQFKKVACLQLGSLLSLTLHLMNMTIGKGDVEVRLWQWVTWTKESKVSSPKWGDNQGNLITGWPVPPFPFIEPVKLISCGESKGLLGEYLALSPKPWDVRPGQAKKSTSKGKYS